MTEAQAIEQIWETWNTGWTALYGSPPSVPSIFENELASDAVRWVRVSVNHTTGGQVSIGPPGARRFERRGNIMVQIFTEIDKGRGPASAIADQVRSILESTRIGTSLGEPVRTYGGRTQEVPTDGSYYMLVVVVPFAYYEQK